MDATKEEEIYMGPNMILLLYIPCGWVISLKVKMSKSELESSANDTYEPILEKEHDALSSNRKKLGNIF